MYNCTHTETEITLIIFYDISTTKSVLKFVEHSIIEKKVIFSLIIIL